VTDATLPPPPEPGERLPLDPDDAVLAEAEAAVDALEAHLDLAPLDRARRVLFLHAHPDDEAIGTGATMATYAADGALVTLVTCTLGEEGEVLVPELAHLASDRDDALGPHRIGELATAMEALGVTDHRFLGGPGRWRDSGMMGTPQNDRPDSFWQAGLDEPVRALVQVMREVRPQVVVTYDPNGGYGHPDHIQVHRVGTAAFERCGDEAYAPELGEPWRPTKLYWTALPKSVLWEGHLAMQAQGASLFGEVESVEDLPMGTPDDEVTTCIDGRDQLDAKIAAMRAYPTQIAVDGPFFALADNVGHRAFGFEYFTLVRGPRGTAVAADGREADLFGGLPEGLDSPTG
jgi:N-acetyl-1-D-myo-inositol-2-amino-2-deoxy-alpha-D-glucopyranoside deacetylase